jgi:ABC-type glycerol-3-phosphate transport system substrate-binding protein
VTRPTRRTFSTEHERPAAIDRAINAVRDDIPPIPPGMDERVLGPIRAECMARTRRERGLRRIRFHGFWTVIAASLVFLAATPLLSSGPAPDPEEAIASVPLTPHCDTTTGHTRLPGRQSGSERPPLAVAGPWEHGEADAFKAVLKRFSAKTGIRVTYAYQTREIAKTLRARLSQRCPPDVALLPQPGLLRELVKNGDLKRIDASTRRLVVSNQGRFWRQAGSVNGRLYGVWFKAANKSTFWYSRRLFNDAGVTPPATWAQLQQTATMLHDAHIAPFSVAGADGWTLTDWFENIYLRTAGSDRYNDLAAHRIPWTHKTVRVALTRMSEMLRRDRMAGGRNGAYMKTGFEDSVDQVFSARPAAAMVYEGDFVRSQIGAAYAHDAGEFRFPAIAGSEPSSVVVGGDVAALLTNNVDGQRLVRFLATVQAARLWAHGGGISPNRRLSADAYPDPTTHRIARALVHAKDKHFDLSDLQPPAFGAASDKGMRKILRDYLSGAVGMNGAMRELETAATQARR